MNGSSPAAISVTGLTKRFGAVVAVDDLSFDVRRRAVTGLIGPDGAGKTTTLRMVLGLVRPTVGQALVDGRPYALLESPARHLGAALEASDFHPGRTARDHMRVLARPHRVADRRVDDVLEQVGLAQVSHRRVGGFSIGLRQRLRLAGALLADPRILVLDEPTSGLDPAGVQWLSILLRSRVRDGGTVLFSGHPLTELAPSADHLVVLENGRLAATATPRFVRAQTWH